MAGRRQAAVLGSAAAAAVLAPAVVLGAAVARSLLAQRRALAYRPTALLAPDAADRRAALAVFGAEARPTGPSIALRVRLDHAVALWRLGVAPVVVVTGGVARGIDEVEVMAHYLAAQGVPVAAVVAARPGQNTREQVASVVRVAGEERLGPVLAVTSPYHVARVAGEARRRGVVMRASSPPTGLGPRDAWTLTVVDAAADLWYRLPTALTARFDTGAGSVRHRLPHVMAGRLPFRALLPAREKGPVR